MNKYVKKGVTLGVMPVALAASMLCATNAVADGLEYHGYVRTQVGGTSQGGNLQCFDPGWPSRGKFRLGNECDNYGEAAFALPFGDSNGVWSKYHATLAYIPNGGADFESIKGGAFDIANRENYFEGGGFFDKGALENSRIWVGKRFYNRHDIHINDFYYWDNSGVGAGIEEINAGPAKLSFAYFQKDGNGGSNAMSSTDALGNRYTMRFYDIDVNKGGKLEGELVYLKGTSAGSAQEGKGYQLFLQHTQSDVLGGNNMLAVVFGQDLGNGFEWLPNNQGGNYNADAKSAFRIHDALYFDNKASNISGQLSASYGQMDSGKTSFWNIGVRPQYNFSNTYSIAVEVAHEEGKLDGGANPALNKITIAPQLALSRGFFSRPVFRAFVTAASWNDDAAKNGVANGVFGTAKNGVTYGFQAEAWW